MKWLCQALARPPDGAEPLIRNARLGFLRVPRKPSDDFIEVEGTLEAPDAFHAVAETAKALRGHVDLDRDLEIQVEPK